jgi:hypothetical protein
MVFCNHASGQEDFFKSAPFSSGIIEAVYSNSGKQSYCEVHFDNYGARYSADLKKSKEDEEIFKSIIRKDGYLFYILHNKKQVVKIPVKERLLPFDTVNLLNIMDTVYKGYNAQYYIDEQDSIQAIYYDNLMLYLNDKYRNMEYRVINITENEAFPEYVFFLPRGFQMTKLNYNFAE